MGRLDKLPYKELRDAVGARYFIETGLGKGDGLKFALRVGGLSHYWSIEADPRAADVSARIAEKFAGDWRAQTFDVVIANSEDGLGDVLDTLERSYHAKMAPAIFWLDAHLPRPGLVAPVYPLLQELRLIRSRRPETRDVFLIDDWRLYDADGAYESGQYPGEDAPAGADRDEILGLLRLTHSIAVDTRDEGYLLAVPR